MDDAELIEKLNAVESSGKAGDRATTNWYRNPEGPQAARTIKALSDKLDRAMEALKVCANAADGWDIDNANLIARTTLKGLSDG